MNAGARGFTLLEMLVVLAVLSLLAGVTLPYLRFSGIDARTAAQDVTAELSLARARALAERRPAALSFDVAQGRFGLDGVLDHELPKGIHLTASLPSGQTNGVVFFPDGGSTGGRLTLSGRGRDASIEVDWLAGSIRHGA